MLLKAQHVCTVIPNKIKGTNKNSKTDIETKIAIMHAKPPAIQKFAFLTCPAENASKSRPQLGHLIMLKVTLALHWEQEGMGYPLIFLLRLETFDQLSNRN